MLAFPHFVFRGTALARKGALPAAVSSSAQFVHLVTRPGDRLLLAGGKGQQIKHALILLTGPSPSAPLGYFPVIMYCLSRPVEPEVLWTNTLQSDWIVEWDGPSGD